MTVSKIKISCKILSVLLCLAMLLSYVPLSSLTAFAADNTKTVYIDGVSGNDENDGTSTEVPVRTLKKAVELAGENGTIIVMQAVNITPAVIQKNELTLENLTIERWENYTTGDLLNVQGSGETDVMKITLKNITVDGKHIPLTDNWNALIQLGNYSELVIEEGAKLINNNSMAVYATTATANVRMTGGEISGNSTNIGLPITPGVYIDEGTFEMSGGTIKNNTNTFFFGGGVYIDYGTFKMTGGTICDNVAHSGGGGVAVNEGEFIMTGGSIVNNKADCNNVEGHGSETTYGGGVYAYDLYSSNTTEVKITISGGEISGNDAIFGDAMSIMSTSTKTTVSMSGSPKIVEEIDIGPKSTAKPVNITADFTPATPVTLNLWGAAVNTVIATYASGLTPNADAFSSYVDTLNPIELEQNIILSDISVSLSSEEFVYNGSAQKPTITVKKGETVLTEGTDYTVTFPTDCENAGEKTVTVNLTGNYSGNIKKTFKIKKADQNAPAVQSSDETVSGENDGTIAGVNETMEYRKDGESTYTAISGDNITGLTAGKYYVRLKGDSNHNPSPDTEVTIAEGSKPADDNTDPPLMGDNSNLWMMFALLFISGGAVVTFTACGKRKTVTNR